MGNMYDVKTTLDIADALLARAKKYACRTHQPVRAVVEEGLRRVLEAKPPSRRHRLRDASVGRPGGHNPLEAMAWSDLRDEIYGGR
jgi:hypothetical protein